MQNYVVRHKPTSCFVPKGGISLTSSLLEARVFSAREAFVAIKPDARFNYERLPVTTSVLISGEGEEL